MKLSKAQMAERVSEYQAIYPDHATKSNQKWVEIAPEKEQVKDEDIDMTVEEANELLKGVDLTDDFDYQKAKELVKVLALKTATSKKDDLLVALEEYKTTLIKPVE
jgi:hypothetical protein